MHSQRNVLEKVDIPTLKEYIRKVKDPLREPPIPIAKKEAREVLEHEKRYGTKELRTQARFRQGVNRMIEEIMRAKPPRTEVAHREASLEPEEKTCMKYSGMVKIGNWEAERAWAEEEMGRFLRLRGRQELGVQKTRQFFSDSLRPVELPAKERLVFGDRVQLIAPKGSTYAGRGAGHGLSLSAVLENGLEGAVLSGSPLLAPCNRNVFELCALEPAGGPLRYGQDFALRYLGLGLPYYVAVLPDRIVPAGNASRHPQVHLSSRLSWSAAWRVMPPSRLGTAVGREVPVGGEVVVISSSLNRTLTAETSHWFSTLFGLECEATAHTYPSGDRNLWRIL